MRKDLGSLPLAFVLAMAAETLSAGVPEAADPNQPLQAGDLRKLLDQAVDAKLIGPPMDQSGERLLPGDKTAQFFPNFPNFPNFNNCFRGNWRNC